MKISILALYDSASCCDDASLSPWNHSTALISPPPPLGSLHHVLVQVRPTRPLFEGGAAHGAGEQRNDPHALLHRVGEGHSGAHAASVREGWALKRRTAEGSGQHSVGTTASQCLCVTPPRPDMLLWPDRMKICLSVELPTSMGTRNGETWF
ncbi:carbohydrate esterase, putative [Actinidia rufa]|uniref:Carbohydrate esterase, putative n=1 Tax=Actinidia rufa TaxID=165716 RepID=A0A7J0ETB4_9ERIC|nr:carbohydrate esterase, putative [Actinidia rufa]